MRGFYILAIAALAAGIPLGLPALSIGQEAPDAAPTAPPAKQVEAAAGGSTDSASAGAEGKADFSWQDFKAKAQEHEYSVTIKDYRIGESATIILNKKEKGDPVEDNFIAKMFGLRWTDKSQLTLRYSFDPGEQVDMGVWSLQSADAAYQRKAPLGYWQADPTVPLGGIKSKDLDFVVKSFESQPALTTLKASYP